MESGPGARTWRERVLKRNPGRDTSTIVIPDVFSQPVRVREAWIYFDVPAGALVAGGIVYFPAVTGARIKFASVNPDVGASPWRFGLRFISDLTTSAALGNHRIQPVYGPVAQLAGQAEAFQFFGVGDMTGQIAQGIPAYPDCLVFPPNVFVAALYSGNIAAEGAICVQEFLGEGEEL